MLHLGNITPNSLAFSLATAKKESSAQWYYGASGVLLKISSVAEPTMPKYLKLVELWDVIFLFLLNLHRSSSTAAASGGKQTRREHRLAPSFTASPSSAKSWLGLTLSLSGKPIVVVFARVQLHRGAPRVEMYRKLKTNK